MKHVKPPLCKAFSIVVTRITQITVSRSVLITSQLGYPTNIRGTFKEQLLPRCEVGKKEANRQEKKGQGNSGHVGCRRGALCAGRQSEKGVRTQSLAFSSFLLPFARVFRVIVLASPSLAASPIPRSPFGFGLLFHTPTLPPRRNRHRTVVARFHRPPFSIRSFPAAWCAAAWRIFPPHRTAPRSFSSLKPKRGSGRQIENHMLRFFMLLGLPCNVRDMSSPLRFLGKI